MSNTIILKKSGVGAKSPITSDLALGEIALNYSDGFIFYRDNESTPAVHKLNADNADTVDGYHLNQDVRTTASPTFAGLTVDTNTLFVDATNDRVGIGTTAPSQKLHVSSGHILLDNNYQIRQKDSGATQRTILQLDSSNNFNVGGSYSGDLIFRGASYAAKMRMTSAGNVGIGTTSPSSKLQIDQYTVGSNGNQSIFGTASIFTDSGSDGLYLGVKNASYPNRGYSFKVTESGINSDFAIKEHGSSGDRLTIKSGGNVGIGTTNPISKLQVRGGITTLGDARYNVRLEDDTAMAQGVGAGLVFGGRYITSSATPTNFACIWSEKENASSGNFAGQLHLGTRVAGTGGAISSDLVINSLGNVGIGTTSPDAPLSVKVGSSTTEAKVFELLANSGRALSILQPDNAQTGDPWTFATSNSYTFRVDAIDAFNIKSDGMVGIGTTAPSEKLVVNVNATGIKSGLILNNEHGYGSGVGVAAAALQFGRDNSPSNGQTIISGQIHSGNENETSSNPCMMAFSTKSGTSPYTLTEHMRIASSGNVGIGTTSPAQKLDVAGKIAVNGSAAVYKPGGNFTGSMFFGDGGGSLSYVSGNDGRFNSGVGEGALYSTTTGVANVASGYRALYHNTTGNYNVASGYRSLENNTTGVNNVGAGYESLFSNTTGINNVASGYQALRNNTTGSSNTTSGYQSLYSNTTGYDNVASGYQSLYSNTTGGNNTATGYRSLYLNTTGVNNVASGYQAGRFIANGSTANATTGTSAFIGANTKASADGVANEIVIGYNAIGSGSNSATLGNSSVTKTVLQGNVGIGTNSPEGKLNIETSAEASIPALGANTTFLKISNAGGAYGSMIGQLGSGDSYFQAQRFDGTATAYDLLLQPNGGNVGIGTTTPSAKLEVNGHFAATTKSFIIDNPKTGGRLQYGVVEGNEHGVYVRGKSDQNEIELPEEWEWLVDEDSVTVHLTSIGQIQQLFVLEQNNTTVKVGGLATNGQYSYVIYGTRKDVDPIEINI